MTRTLTYGLLLALLALPAPAADTVRHIEDGVLDEIKLMAETIPTDLPVRIAPFTAEKADLGTGAPGGKPKRVAIAKEMQNDGPGMLAGSLVKQLRKMGPFQDVELVESAEGAGQALRIEGRFTKLDPGSKAKRYWAGFGAGKGSVEVTGQVTLPDGTVIAEFTQKRITVMGAMGGDYRSKMSSDCNSIGEDIAKFLNRWAEGGRLDK